MKSATWRSGERDALKQLGVEVRVMGEGFYKILDDHKDPKQHKAAAQHALAAAKEAICSGKYQLVVLDELGSAVDEKLLSKKEVEDVLQTHRTHKVGKKVHVIWTGHNKVSWMVKDADLVTDMKMVKHPYYRGIIATMGLDY
jgi:cob(I)alamin adenosyltransferase